jgi:hypothetical protein
VLYFAVTTGSVNQYNKTGTMALMNLSEANRHLVSWEKDKFALNEQALAADIELHKIYAQSPEQLAELAWWENLCTI